MTTFDSSLRERLSARKPLRIEEAGSLETSVAVILSPGAAGPEVLLIRRAEREGDPWSGHIGLPGGRCEPGDPDRLHTALRETEEEIGVRLDASSLLGALDDLHPRTPSLPPVIIRPFVFSVASRPAARVSDEVAAVYSADLAALLEAESTTRVPIKGLSAEVPCFTSPCLPEGKVIWGLTYRILSGLRPLLRGSVSACLFAVLAAAQALGQTPSKDTGSPRTARGHADVEIPHPPLPPPVLEEQPFPLRLIMKPLRRGIFIRLPIMDTDPNRGVTIGFMPIWVLNGKGEDEDRIVHIHAPSVTYNKILKITATYRYYYYPDDDSSLTVRAAASQVSDREVLAQYESYSLHNGDLMAGLKLHHNVDSSYRFFGIGPDTSKKAEANYTYDVIQYTGFLGVSPDTEDDWHLIFSHHMAGERIRNGAVDSQRNIKNMFPGAAPEHRHQNSAVRATINYDSRDSAMTTREGLFTEFFAESAERALGSEYAYQRYGSDIRYFFQPSKTSRWATAGRVKYEQVLGDNSHFWLLPQLGGKLSLRGFGDGRYADQGLLTSSIEERCTVGRTKAGGVTTEFEVAPFAEVGTVFARPGRMAARYLRTVAGVALRAVARPQVVGSIDFGVGREGLAVFMDINYSF